MNVCFCCVRFSFFSTKPRDWLERMSLKSPIFDEWDIKPLLKVKVLDATLNIYIFQYKNISKRYRS